MKMTCADFVQMMLDKAAEETKGCRNIKERAAQLAERYAKENGTGEETEFCVRVVGKNLGSYKWKDIRKVLETVIIVKKTKTLYIGLNGERVSPESIVQFCEEL